MKRKTLLLVYLLIYLYFWDKMSTQGLLFSIPITIYIIGINIFVIFNEKIETFKKFGIFALFFGIILIFSIPILHGIDEGAHFFRVYSFFSNTEVEYSENRMIDKIPIAIVEADKIESISENNIIKDLKIDENETILTEQYIGAKLYSPISYITYLPAMYICKNLLNLDIFWIIILGRICSFLAWIFISVYTIKIVPRRKDFFSFLCLMPISLTLVTTYTGDLITNASIFLFIAIWYRLYEEKRIIKKSEIILIIALGILSVCSKMVYALIFLIIFLLPQENFRDKKHKIITSISILLILSVIFFINISIVGNDLLDSYPAISEQKDFVLRNIIVYIKIFFNTLITNFPMYVYQFTTGLSTMCHNTIIIDNAISVIYLFIIIISLYIEKSNIKLTPKVKFLLYSIVITIISIIFLSLYLQWTATNYGVGYEIIEGVQGRYFIPVVILAIFVNENKKYEIKKENLWTIVTIIDFIILLEVISKFV